MYEIYKVQTGDTLDSIANKYGTTQALLLQINGLPDSYTPLPNPEIIVPLNQNSTYKYYTVKKGDNMYRIAEENNVNYELLLQINGLEKDDYIYPNQVIMLPVSGYSYYVTAEGDTLNSVSDIFKKNIQEVVKENETIYLLPGQILVSQRK